MSQSVSDIGPELSRLRKAAGMTLSALADRIHYSKGYLCRVEKGQAHPAKALIDACDQALDAGGALSKLFDAESAGTDAAASTRFSGLPGVTRHFTGRTDELTTIRHVLADEPATATVCVLTGMAGVGKTALAVRAAQDVEQRFPDGCLFFDLHGHTPGSADADSHEVLDRLLHLLGVPGADIPPDTGSRANLYRDRLRGRRMLLVFDNARSATQVTDLLPAEPRCRVLITSRYRLNALDDAVLVPVGVLSAAGAVELFCSVAGDRAADAVDVVRRIVEDCGRLPLAVRIAAARFRGSPMWTIEEFAARLADETVRLRALDDGERSVAAAFHLSYQGLPVQERRLFGLLSLHPGRDIAVRSAAALAGLGLAETERLLDRLHQAHLIIPVPGGYTRFHDLVRVYAIEHALPELPVGEQEDALRRLLDFALLQALSGDRLLSPRRYRPELAVAELPSVEPGFVDQDAALAWWDQEWPNLVALCKLASVRCQHTQCWQLAVLLRDFFFRAKLWDPWIDTHGVAAAAARAMGDERALAMTLSNLGMAHADRGDLVPARGHYSEALALFDSVGDEHGTAVTRSSLAWVDFYLGDARSALLHLGNALAWYRRSESDRNAAITLRGIAFAETALGRLDDALHHAEQSYAEVRELGLALDMAMGRNCVAWIHFRADRYDDAKACYTQAAQLAERCGSRYELARAWTGLGNVAARTGNRAEADELWARAHALDTSLNPVMVGEAVVRLAIRAEPESDVD